MEIILGPYSLWFSYTSPCLDIRMCKVLRMVRKVITDPSKNGRTAFGSITQVLNCQFKGSILCKFSIQQCKLNLRPLISWQNNLKILGWPSYFSETIFFRFSNCIWIDSLAVTLQTWDKIISILALDSLHAKPHHTLVRRQAQITRGE